MSHFPLTGWNRQHPMQLRADRTSHATSSYVSNRLAVSAVFFLCTYPNDVSESGSLSFHLYRALILMRNWLKANDRVLFLATIPTYVYSRCTTFFYTLQLLLASFGHLMSTMKEHFLFLWRDISLLDNLLCFSCNLNDEKRKHLSVLNFDKTLVFPL